VPIFEYTCNACGHQFEFLKLPAATAVALCPACQSADLTRMLSGFALSTTDLTKARVKAARKRHLESKDHKDKQVADAEEVKHHRDH
jgi:putative FmdB family regulatory protein